MPQRNCLHTKTQNYKLREKLIGYIYIVELSYFIDGVNQDLDDESEFV